MAAKWLLTALIAILVLPIYAQEALNSTDIDLVEEAATRRATARPPRSSTWTKKCSAKNAVGCASTCNFFTGSCSKCQGPNYVKSSSGGCMCARGYYNPSIGKRKLSIKASKLTDKFYQKSSCAPCPSQHTCGGGTLNIANCEPKCQGVGYLGVDSDGQCRCARGFMLYKTRCGKYSMTQNSPGTMPIVTRRYILRGN
jgi:hypothetical protein